MTVKQESAGGRGIAEIHSQLHAVVGSGASPVRDFDGVTKIVIRSRLAIDLHDPKVDLVNVEGMGLKGAVLDRPIFNRADLGGNHGLFVGLEDLLFLSVYGDVELDWTIGAAEFLGKKQLALNGRGLLRKVEELYPIRGGGRGLRHVRVRRVAGGFDTCQFLRQVQVSCRVM